MPADFRGIPYVEHVPGSPVESWANDAARITRLIDVDWESRFQFVVQALGYAQVRSVNDGPLHVSRVTPQECPEYPWMLAQSIPVVEGVGFRGQNTTKDMGRYETARCTVVYEALTYEILEDAEIKDASGVPDESKLLRYITRTYHPAGEFLTTPLGLFKWVEPPKIPPVNYPTPRRVPFVEVGYTWHLVPFIPLNTIKKTLGTVNDAVFDPDNPQLKGGYEPETLLLLAADIKPIKQAIGPFPGQDNLIYDIHYRMKYLPNNDLVTGTARGHNFFLRNLGGTGPLNYTRITDTGAATGKPPYPLTDFKKLFKVSSS